jgi:hypothetical protein
VGFSKASDETFPGCAKDMASTRTAKPNTARKTTALIRSTMRFTFNPCLIATPPNICSLYAYRITQNICFVNGESNISLTPWAQSVIINKKTGLLSAAEGYYEQTDEETTADFGVYPLRGFP